MMPARTCFSEKGLIMPCSNAMSRIQRSLFTDMSLSPESRRFSCPAIEPALQHHKPNQPDHAKELTITHFTAKRMHWGRPGLRRSKANANRTMTLHEHEPLPHREGRSFRSTQRYGQCHQYD